MRRTGQVDDADANVVKSDALRKRVWETAFRLEAEGVYFSCKYASEVKADKWMRTFLLITASGGVLASLPFWNKPDYKWIWCVIAIANAAVAGIHTTMGFKGNVEALANIFGDVRSAATNAASLWNDYDSLDGPVISRNLKDMALQD